MKIADLNVTITSEHLDHAIEATRKAKALGGDLVKKLDRTMACFCVVTAALADFTKQEVINMGWTHAKFARGQYKTANWLAAQQLEEDFDDGMYDKVRATLPLTIEVTFTFN